MITTEFTSPVFTTASCPRLVFHTDGADSRVFVKIYQQHSLLYSGWHRFDEQATLVVPHFGELAHSHLRRHSLTAAVFRVYLLEEEDGDKGGIASPVVSTIGVYATRLVSPLLMRSGVFMLTTSTVRILPSDGSDRINIFNLSSKKETVTAEMIYKTADGFNTFSWDWDEIPADTLTPKTYQLTAQSIRQRVFASSEGYRLPDRYEVLRLSLTTPSGQNVVWYFADIGKMVGFTFLNEFNCKETAWIPGTISVKRNHSGTRTISENSVSLHDIENTEEWEFQTAGLPLPVIFWLQGLLDCKETEISGRKRIISEASATIPVNHEQLPTMKLTLICGTRVQTPLSDFCPTGGGPFTQEFSYQFFT